MQRQYSGRIAQHFETCGGAIRPCGLVALQPCEFFGDHYRKFRVAIMLRYLTTHRFAASHHAERCGLMHFSHRAEGRALSC